MVAIEKTLRHIHRAVATRLSRSSGRSSGVEHNLAKVGVVSSNLIARSNISRNLFAIDLSARWCGDCFMLSHRHWGQVLLSAHFNLVTVHNDYEWYPVEPPGAELPV